MGRIRVFNLHAKQPLTRIDLTVTFSVLRDSICRLLRTRTSRPAQWITSLESGGRLRSTGLMHRIQTEPPIGLT